MRFALRLLLAATLLGTVATVAVSQQYHAFLSGLNEVGPNASPGTGFATMTLDGAKMLTIHMEYSGLLGPITASHIHGAAGVCCNAGVRFGIGALPSPINIVVGPFTPADEADLNNQLMYINIHTQVIPGGEIRGQIMPGAIGVEPGTWGEIKALFRNN
jgi:hypothetical protein